MSKKEAFQGTISTSSKEWTDFNVHKAFQQTIGTGYYAKYEEAL